MEGVDFMDREAATSTGNRQFQPGSMVYIYIYGSGVWERGVIYRTLCNGRDFYNNVGHWRHGNWRKEKKKD